MSDDYVWAGGREGMLRVGPPGDRAGGALIVFAPALFEEANRMRAVTVAVMRGLAARGVASLLPDLPGMGESLVDTVEARLAHWRAAFAAVATRATHVVAIRGGAILAADVALPQYHMSPADGAAVVRDLVRTRRAAAREDGATFDPGDLAAPGPPILLAGNSIARELLGALADAHGRTADRTVRLDGDPRPADRRLTGRPLWRAAEPGSDAALADTLAGDIADWVACGA